MRKIGFLTLGLAGLTLALAVIGRVTGQPIPLMPLGVEPLTLLNVTNILLLTSIALFLAAKK